MAAISPTSSLRQVLEQRLSQLSTEMENLFGETRDRARRELADQLNQAVRRIRQAANAEELGSTLVDAACAFSTGAALFRIAGEAAKCVQARGVPEAPTPPAFEIPLASAAALAEAAATRDPVIAATSPAEVSPEIAQWAGDAPDGRVFIFPLEVRGQIAALLVAWGAVQGPAVELLSQAAAAVWTAMPLPLSPDLVQIAEASVAPASAWDRLSADEQQIHLRAQRFARVRVAEIRLSESEAVQAGRARGDLYGELRKSIDTARSRFREQYFDSCPSMVDYLHLELVQTLAHDDPELLGKDYPGPLV